MTGQLDYHSIWQGPLYEGVDETTFHTEAPGADLFCRCWRPAAEAVAAVQLVHGMAEHSGRYRHVASVLASRGWVVYAHDHRGHGHTAVNRNRLGLLAEKGGWRHAVDDVHRINEHIGGEHPELPVALVGHSMGSFLAQHYAIEHGERLAALVLSGSDNRSDLSALVGSFLAGTIARLRGPGHRSGLLRHMTTGAFRRQIDDADSQAAWLSRDRAVVRAFEDDPLTGFEPSAAMWRDILRGVHFIGRTSNRSHVPPALPVLLMVGGADPLSDGGRRVRLLAEAYRKAGLRDVSVREYPLARHEVFNEINRTEVLADLVDWLASRLSSGEESGA
ncbi:alpha/beta hydrolase [Ectothiorhodospiraceae bacterium WFHF3C12]|nr:alpha/beta hydrolase [Ectothiorhodospiraceae bacterium WFHF3C12]